MYIQTYIMLPSSIPDNPYKCLANLALASRDTAISFSQFAVFFVFSSPVSPTFDMTSMFFSVQYICVQIVKNDDN